MTLDDLKERVFDAVRAMSFCPKAATEYIDCLARGQDVFREFAHSYDNYRDHTDKEVVNVWLQAKIYVVALDEGLNAAMLWKLGNYCEVGI